MIQYCETAGGEMVETYKIMIPVRFRDLDCMGHVNNAVFFTYFEVGRESFWSDHIAGHIDKSESYFILAHISCDFMKPITLTTKLSLKLSVTKIGKKSFDYLYILADSDDESIEYARGESVQVCYDYSRNRSIELSPEFRGILSRFYIEGPR